jgi:hypothetical protein
MTASLCLCDHDTFLAHYWSVVEILKRKLPKLKSAGLLQLIHLIVEVYLNRFPGETDSIVDKLQSLIPDLFPAKKWILATPECLDALAKMTTMIAKSRPEFAMNNIVFELLKGEIVIAE